MGYPSPNNIYGTIKYESVVYNLKNRQFSEEQNEKINQFVKQENIKLMPFFPHIPKNLFTCYEVIDSKLYITKINFSDKSYKPIDIFGEEVVECDFDIILKAVVNTTEFVVDVVSKKYYKQEIKNFYFKNGVLKDIKDNIEFNTNLTRRLKGYWEVGEKQGYIGIFWVLNNKIYSAKQQVKDFLREQDLEKAKFTLSPYEIWNFLKERFEELSGLNSKKLTSGDVTYDVKNDKFIISSNTKIDKNLVIDDFVLQDSRLEFDIVE